MFETLQNIQICMNAPVQIVQNVQSVQLCERVVVLVGKIVMMAKGK